MTEETTTKGSRRTTKMKKGAAKTAAGPEPEATSAVEGNPEEPAPLTAAELEAIHAAARMGQRAVMASDGIVAATLAGGAKMRPTAVPEMAQIVAAVQAEAEDASGGCPD